ncbi:MAG: DUF4382 domain-containing protein [Acidobacteria bacterium]|nr:DUF4382 domain-containing protein [Acidobacteriota bacterium]
MSSRNRALILFFASLLVAGAIFLACGNVDVQGTLNPAMGTVAVHFSDPPTCEAPAGPYSHVYVTIRGVRAHRSSTADAADSEWVDLAPGLANTPRQVDLLGTANASCFLASLGSNQLEAGRYQQIRLLLLDNNSGGQVSGNQCSGNDANCVVLAADGSIHELNLSSEANTGIKIPSGQIAGGGFVVEEGQTTDLDIDLNACASIVITGNGQFRLKPVLHAGEVSLQSSSISGRVMDSVTSQPIAGGTVLVALEQNVNGVDRVVQQTMADALGNFTFCPVLDGTYDVVAAAVGGNGVAYAATVTTGVNDGTSMGNIPLIATTGMNTAVASITGQVTTSTGAAATSADIELSALQPIGNNVLATIPLATQSAVTLSLATAADAACPVNTNCASYTLSVPGLNPNLGAFNSGGTTYTQNTVDPVGYTVGARAFVPMSGSTANCNPSELTISTLQGGGALVVTPGGSVTAETLAFTACQ